MEHIPHKRVLLKVSGEVFCEKGGRGFSPDAIKRFGQEILWALEKNPGTELAIMPGGGNHGRGDELIDSLDIDPLAAHQAAMAFLIGNMIISGAYLTVVLKPIGIEVREMTSVKADALSEPYLPKVARSHLRKKRVVVLGGGSGEAFKSTDYASTIKAAEMNCDLILKGTKVDGVFTGPPGKDPNAVLIPYMTPQEFLERKLTKIFDEDGVAKLGKLHIPLRIFNFFKPGTLAAVLAGKEEGTLIATDKAKGKLINV